MRVTTAIMSSVYLARPDLFPLLPCHLVSTTLRHGVTRQSPYGFAVFAIVLNVIGQIDVGHATGETALRLLDRWDDRAVRARTEHVVYNQIKAYTEPIRPTLDAQLRVFRLAMDTGDLEYAAWALQAICCNAFYAGVELPDVGARIDRHLAMMRRHRQLPAVECTEPWSQVVRNLVGQAADSRRLVGPGFDESERMATLRATNFRGAACVLTTAGTFVRYVFRDLEGALTWADAGGEFLDGAGSTYHVIWWHQYRTLAHLALDRPPEAIAASRAQLGTWLRFSPVNHQHRVDLVDAEIARVLGRDADAIALYERSILHARNNRFAHEEALAHELAGRFYAARGGRTAARAHLLEGRWLWQRWGATAKADQLQSEFADLVGADDASNGDRATAGNRRGTSVTDGALSTGTLSGELDLETLFRGSLALSGEIRLDRLVGEVVSVTIQNAGATRGFLVTEREGELVIEVGRNAEGAELVAPGTPLSQVLEMATTVTQYVARTGEHLVLADGAADPRFASDPYLRRGAVSILCTPLVHKGRRTGIIYLENHLVTGCFTPARLRTVQVLASQAAVSIQNASLIDNLEAKVTERTQALQGALERTRAQHEQLVLSQQALVHSERLAVLGAPRGRCRARAQHAPRRDPRVGGEPVGRGGRGDRRSARPAGRDGAREARPVDRAGSPGERPHGRAQLAGGARCEATAGRPAGRGGSGPQRGPGGAARRHRSRGRGRR